MVLVRIHLNRSSGPSLDLELRGCRDTFGEVSGKGCQRVTGNGASYSWGVWGTVVGPAAGSLQVV